jgi:hypothetical protein
MTDLTLTVLLRHRPVADISTLAAAGHFYLGLTSYNGPCSTKVDMSAFAKVEMSTCPLS